MPFSLAKKLQNKFHRTWSIPLRLGLVLMIIGIYIPSILVSLFFAYNIFVDEQKRINEINLAYAKTISFSLDSQFRIIESGLIGLRNSYLLSSDNLPAFYNQASGFVKSADLLSIVLSDESERIIFSTSRPIGEKLPKLAGSGSQEIFEGKRATVSNLFIGPITKDWLMVVRVPVFDRNNKVRYALSATYSTAQLNQFLDKQIIQPSQIITVIDPTGRIGARSRLPNGIVGTMVRPKFKLSIDSSPSGFFEGPNRENIPISAAYYKSPETNWTVSLATPLTDIYNQEWNKLKTFLGLSLLTLGFGLIFSLRVSTEITAAIKELIPLAKTLGLARPIQPLSGPIKEVNEVSSALQDASIHLEEAKYRAYHDPLTGLANRTMMNFNLDQQISLAEREGQSIGLLFLDLDDFKKVNDSYGHNAGDALLREVSLRLKNAVRNSDTVARFGGDEFVALLVHADEKMGVSIAHKILEAITSSPVMLGTTPVQISCSIGVAAFPDCANNISDLYRKADQALYIAKNLGKNQVYEASKLISND